MRTARIFTTASLVAALTISLAATGVAGSGPEASGDATAKPGARDVKPHVALPVLQPMRRPSGDDDLLTAGTGAGDVSEVEPNDSSSQPIGDVPFNVRGTISSPADIGDCFSFPATAGDPVRVEVIADRVFGSLLDSIVLVFQDDGATVVIENDDGVPGSRDSFARFTAPYTGLYFVCVQDAMGTGSAGHVYVLNVTVANGPDAVEQEPNDSFGLADPLTLPAFATGSSGAENDVDVFRFQGTGGTTLIVDVDAAIFSGSLDAVVDLFDGSGRRIFAFDDDGSSGSLDTRFNIVLPASGTYFLAVRDITGRGGGLGYRVNVSSQSGVGAPRIDRVKFTPGGLAKKLVGSGFGTSGAVVELTNAALFARQLPSRNGPAKPQTTIKIAPATAVSSGDVLTVVLPNGRRSNPTVLN